MLTGSQSNLCIRIARGDINIQDVKDEITEEMKKRIEQERKLIEIHKSNGRPDLVNATCADE